VAVLIALLAGVFIARAGRSGSKSAVLRAGRELYLTARYARVAAVQSGREVALVLDGKQGRFLLTRSGEKADQGEQVISDSYSRAYKLPETVKIERVKTEADECVFYPDGGAEPALVQIGDGGSSVTVLVNALGRVRLVQGVVEDVETGRVDLDKK